MAEGDRTENRRLDIAGVERGGDVVIEVNGRHLIACEGESLAAALMRTGPAAMRATSKRHEPRGYYCGMGVCHECLVDVVGTGLRRSCQLIVFEGLRVRVPESDR